MKLKLGIIGCFLLSCAHTAVEPQPASQCIEPPGEYEGIALTMCEMAGKYNVCGYGFLPDGPKGKICFLTLMQSNGCQDEWRFVDASCFENPWSANKGTPTKYRPDTFKNLHRATRG